MSCAGPWGWCPHPPAPWSSVGPQGQCAQLHPGAAVLTHIPVRGTQGWGSPPALGLCGTLGLGGPYQGILVDIGPLDLLGSVPSQDHGSAQHIQVLLQGHRTRERTTWELDLSLLQPADTLVPKHTPGMLMG